MVCFETAEAEMIVEDVQPITSWADSIDDEDEYFYNVSRAPIPSWAVMDVTFEAAEDPEPSPSGPVRAEIPVVQKRVIRDGWRSRVVLKKTSVMPPVTTDSAGHPSKLERQKEKSESLVPPAPASVPKTAPRDAVDTPKVSKKPRRRKRKIANAPSQSEEINGQETSTEPITPDSPPQQESSAQRLDEPDQVKSESLIPPADAADPKAAPRDAVDTPKVSKKPRRRKRKMANASSQNQGIGGQETSTAPSFTPPSPPQKKSTSKTLKSRVPPAPAAALKTAAVVQKRVIRDGWKSRVVWQKTSVMPPVTTDSAGHPSKLERQKEKSESLVPPAPASVPKTAPRDAVDTPKVSSEPRRRIRKVSKDITHWMKRCVMCIVGFLTKSGDWWTRDVHSTLLHATFSTLKSTSKTLKSRVPPAPAAALKTAVNKKRVIRDGWRSWVIWQKTSVMPPVTTDSAGHPSKLERQKEKSESVVPPAPASVPRAAPSQSEEINGQETSTEPIMPDSPPQQESSAQRLDEPDQVKSESLIPPADAADPKAAPRDAVDTPKVSKKPRRRKRKIAKAPSQSEEINGQETSTEPIMPNSPPQQESSAQRLDEPDPVKSESLIPPADAAVPKAAPRDAVDTPKVSKKPRRRKRKIANASSQNQGIGGQDTSRGPSFTPPSPPQKESTKTLKSRVPPAPAAALKTAAVVQKRVIRDGWRSRVVWQKTSVMPPVTTDSAGHPSKLERQKEKSESLVPPAPASVPKTAPSQRQETGGQETATKPVVTPASPSQGQRSAWGTSLPQLQRPRDKPETLVPPAPADVPRAAPSQSEEINGQETSTEPITPDSPPQQESSAQRLDEPDQVKSESLIPQADAAVPKAAPRDAVDTPKVSKKPRRRKRKVSKASSQNQGIGGQETSRGPSFTPPSPPQKESTKTLKSRVPPAPAAALKTAPSQSEEINGQETSTEPITPDSPPQQESSAQRLDEPDQVKSESLIPPADAAVPKAAPRDAVDTPKVSKKPRRRKRKVANDITHWMKRCVMCIVGFLTKSGDWWTRDVHSTLLHATFSTLKSTSKALKSRVPPAPAAALKTAAVVQKRVIRDGWRSWVIWQKTSVMPPVTTDSAGHPSKLERQKEKSESLVPPAPASVPKTAPSQRQETGGQETATKPVVTPASPSEGQRSAWGTSLPQLQRPRDKPETLVPPAPADVPRAAPSQSEEINGQETSTEPITPDSPPQQESSAQRLDEPDQVKSESLIPQADAADPKAAPRDAVDTPKVSKKPRRRKRKMANASSQNQGIGGQETFTAPSFTPPSPPQKESTKTLKSRVPPAPAAALKTAPSQSEEINGQETSTEPITPDSPPQQESSAQRLDEPDPVKSESLIPPADAADPKAAPRDAVDTPKVSKKPRRRKRKVANASSQNQGIGGQETSRGPSFTPPSPPQNESSMRLDKPDPVKSEPLVPPADGALPKTVLRKQEIAGEETQRQEASDTGTSVVDLCERLEKVHQSSKPPARATQAPEPESNRK
ncbi:titin-like isoform X2 [Triplophysa dalaica]|uniref:titin-like isoform X2 n=1 Tax=Triplophysa dalaica TaxID=1582913 RepID=UPI0024DFB439|nr:titin-like isoform X2 [Triplophysa dalaica]